MNRILFYIVTAYIMVFTNIVLYLNIKNLNFKYKKGFDIFIYSVNILSCGFFFTRMLFHNNIKENFYNIFSTIGFNWLFIACYTSMFFSFYYLVQFLDHKFNFIPTNYKLFNTKIKFIYLISVISLIFLLRHLGSANFNNVKIKHIKQKSQVKLNKNYRLVMISDVHLGRDIGLDKLDNYIFQINNLKPDIVIIAGDLFDFYVTPLYNAGVVEKLKKIKTNYGTYYILGNHEYYAKQEKIVKKIAYESGFFLLRDSYVIVNNELIILGRDDYHNKNRLPLDRIIKKRAMEEKKFKIAVDHNPKKISQSIKYGFNLIFAGHTHNGQIFPVNILVKLIYKYAYGLYKPNDNCNVYVSCGLGLWGPQYRIGSQSEIVLFEIY